MMEALSPANIGLLLFGIFFVLLLIGSPIMVALGVATMACFIVLDIDLSLMIERAFASLTAFPLMALPAFVLAGSLMEAAGVSRRLVHVAENIVGPTPGGLAISTTLSCVFFGAISGSGPATTAAVGMLMIPAMAKRGYNVGYAAAATATASASAATTASHTPSSPSAAGSTARQASGKASVLLKARIRERPGRFNAVKKELRQVPAQPSR